MTKDKTNCPSHRKMERKLELKKWQLVVLARVLALLSALITHC